MSKVELSSAVDSFFKFLDEPQKVKETIDYKLSKAHRRAEVGYKKREAEDNYKDRKDFFHYHPIILLKHKEFIQQHSVVEDFLEKANVVWEAIESLAKQILTLLECDYPDLVKKVYDTDNTHLLLRFLKYEWDEAGKYLAKPHFDAGSFTIAISESCKGLRIGKSSKDLTEVEHEDGKVLFMLSRNCDKLGIRDLPPGWHDAIQSDDTNLGKSCARWAVVFFIEGHNVTAPDKKETHKFHIEELEGSN